MRGKQLNRGKIYSFAYIRRKELFRLQNKIVLVTQEMPSIAAEVVKQEVPKWRVQIANEACNPLELELY